MRREVRPAVPEWIATDEELLEQFSGCLFFIDEAHNIFPSYSQEGKDISGQIREELGDKEIIYNALHRLAHLILRSKWVVASATPMINKLTSPWLLNILLKLNQQFPLNWDYTKVSLTQFEPYLRGKLTFIRGLYTGAITRPANGSVVVPHQVVVQEPLSTFNVPIPPVTNQFEKPPQPEPPMVTRTINPNITVYPLGMQGVQNAVYTGGIYQGVQYQRIDPTVNFYHDGRQVSNFVFPDGSYGGEITDVMRAEKKELPGFSSWVTSDKKDNYAPKEALKPWLRVADFQTGLAAGPEPEKNLLMPVVSTIFTSTLN